MKILKKVIIVLILFIIISFVTALIDFKRVNNNQKPVYSVINNNVNSKREVFTGIIYKLERVYNNSIDEKLSDSKELKFKLLGKELKLNDVIKPKENMKINTKEKTKCLKSKLLYADKDIKIYTYCLDEITINSYDKDYTLIEYIKKNKFNQITKNLRFDGITIDKSSLELVDNNNISNNGIKVIECNINNVTDIYIGPNNMTYQEDFCTNKDDDFDFMWTIVDKHSDSFKCAANSEKEIVYENEKNIYTFNCLMSDKIFVNTPALRGKNEQNIPIKDALKDNIVTINEAINRGLKVNTEKK